jgi:hypothetical protein
MSYEEEETFYTEGNESKQTFNTSTSSILNDSKPEFHDSGTTMSDSSNDSSRSEEKPTVFLNHDDSDSLESFVEQKPDDASSVESRHVESLGHTSDEDATKTTTIMQQPDIISESILRPEPKPEIETLVEKEEKPGKVEIKRPKTLSYKIHQAVSVSFKLIQILVVFWLSLLGKMFEIVFNRKKVIRNQNVLITGSAGYLGERSFASISLIEQNLIQAQL